jgi:alkylation response protein AidB-like acyl-CoA dehydrogenase
MDKTIWKRCAEAGILAAFAASKWYPEYAGDKIAGGIRPDEFDAFCELIAIDEVSRSGSGGVVWGLFEGLQIGGAPLLSFGTKEQQQKVLGPCLRGEKVICLAISTLHAARQCCERSHSVCTC